MVRDAYPYILTLLSLAFLAGVLGVGWNGLWYWPAGILLLLAIFVGYFFRDPEREVPPGEDLVVSPADGLVVVVKPVEAGGQEKGTLVSIFLSVFDVHVNRSPIGGEITQAEYRSGKFLVASLERASHENEQQIVTVTNPRVTVVFKMIAGLIARRIVFWKREGDRIGRGERVGLIKFGSRVDVILPANVEVAVRKGQRVKGGSSILGKVVS